MISNVEMTCLECGRKYSALAVSSVILDREGPMCPACLIKKGLLGGPEARPDGGLGMCHPELRTGFPANGLTVLSMSLRDWFAGQALIGLIAGRQYNATLLGHANNAYVVADLMLEARGKFDKHKENLE